ncbi:MAG TPA: amidase [Bryobacteraceae bacterium]|nr:amidase [Bryobacteraceae bacterium]
MRDLLCLSATHQARLIREREISPQELIETHREQIARVNPAIHAVVEELRDGACGSSFASLAGVPFSIKDSIEVAETVCTAGTMGRRSAAPSTEDATVVARLRAAGGIPIAKTNLPDLLFAFESDNLLFGATNNPYDLTRTSGGSSGGEAALIASGGSPLGLGSDCAGSVRLPAAFCGIAGIKPTSGRLPRTGHFPPAGGWIEALWQIGPMARYVEDLVTVMPLLAGSDGRDATTVTMPVHDPREVELRELRLAFYTDNGIAAADADVTRVVHAAASWLAAEVRSMDEARPACLECAYDLEMKLLGADGGDGLWQYLAELGSSSVHPLLRAWLEKLEAYRTDRTGVYRYWNEWDRYRAEMFAFLRDYDAILCPAYIQAALPHGTSILDENFRGFSHTMAYNLTGWPAAVVRCGETGGGLPVAVQVVARPWREDVALRVAGTLEEMFGGWKPPTATW